MNWDLKSYFPKFDGKEMQEFKSELENDIDALLNKAFSLTDLKSESINDWKTVLLELEDISRRYSHIRSYVGCLAAADANNENYLKEEANLSVVGSEIQKIEVEVLRAFKEADKEMVEKLHSSDDLKTASYFINRIHKESSYQMSQAEEVLASDLGINGISAWGRLYNTASGKLTFKMEFPDGEVKELPMSQRRSLMENSNRGIRKAAFKGGNDAWESIEHVAAASLNAISGTRLTLNKHRDIPHFLDVALFQSALSKETLDAMFEAIYEKIDIPREILKFKAETMGEKGISWYDLGAPLNLEDRQEIDWENAKSMVHQSFSSSYPKLGDFISDVYKKQWIEWEPREGKRPGGFCTGSLLTGESRIFMTYNSSLGDVLTLAHEAGHAFHSYIMNDLRPFQHYYPMTLAETASTFGEMILSEGILNDKNISDSEKVLMLDTEINHGAIYLLDIPVRYEFEKSLYEERAKGELTVSKLKELMTETQKKVFGDVLIEGDAYFWASKLHFYITGVTFYNYPYTFGYLLSRSLFRMFKDEGEKFLDKYEKFLLLSGSNTCENVVKKSIGEDIQSKQFWMDAIDTLNEPLENLKELLPKVT